LHIRLLISSPHPIKDPEYSESDENEDEQIQTISAKRAVGKGAKRKGRKKDVHTQPSNNEDASNEPSTVIYVGHLPVGFEEREITVFLNQFGNVKRCRVSRSTKTGRSRGYAFVDFADVEVAKIVAESMSGYFLLEKRLVCHVLPNDKVHELTFAKPKRVPTKVDRQKKARTEINKRRSADAMMGVTAKLVKREEMKRKKIAALGIDYDFPGYTASAAAASQSVAESDGSSKKKKRKISDGDEVKTHWSEKSKKSKRSNFGGEEEKENEDEDDTKNASEVKKKTPKSDKKRAKKSKTPKKKK
jgi:nucleolar protein 15